MHDKPDRKTGTSLAARRWLLGFDNHPGSMRLPFDIELALKAVVGTASPVLGVISSFQEQIEWHLRIPCLCSSASRSACSR